MKPRRALFWLLPVAAAVAVAVSAQQLAPPSPSLRNPADIQRALADARAQSEAARLRAEKLEGEAALVTAQAEKTARTAAGVAARIQQAEAQILSAQARIGLIDRQRERLRARLAERQRPLVRLTAALQRLSRRPPALSLLRPGSVSDTMHMRAILETMMPEVERRTAALRSEIERSRQLQAQARLAESGLRKSQGELLARRKTLVALETRQRLASRAAGGTADREAERALALAEQARDLDGLAAGVERAGELRQALARLPGPILRPDRPEASQVVAVEAPAASPGAQLPAYIMPAAGRLVAGFGESAAGTARSRGITLATQPGAQAVAPAPGRVVFAGRYQGYGQIVIIEHPGGWTSLVTGLARLDVQVGETLVAGSPLGVAGVAAGGEAPRLMLELRRGGQPVNPLDHLRAL